MTANTSPIYTKTPNHGFGVVATANTAMDGTGTVVTVFTAGASGSYVSEIVFKFAGSSVATVARIFENNGSSTSVAANNSLVMEQQLPNVTASNSTPQPDIVVPVNRTLPAGYKLTVAIGTTVASNIAITVLGGDY